MMRRPEFGKLTQRRQAQDTRGLFVRDKNPSLVTAIKLVISSINLFSESLQGFLAQIFVLETFAKSLNASCTLVSQSRIQIGPLAV